MVTTLYADPLDTYEGYLRFHHMDLSDLGDSDLLDELSALRPLLWGLPANDWLRERAQVLRAETDRRAKGKGQGALSVR